MRWSQYLALTLREAPAEAEIISHQLLLRAGLTRKLGSGVYTFLPLGLRALRKVENIVREEMNRAGALELLMPALQPVDLWKNGPRYEAAQRVMFRAQGVTSRERDFEWVLGPTHEEVITEMAAGLISSYKQLPRTFYQIQSKFRDETRPRFGLMRAREFIMKDAYSFDVTDDAVTTSYQKMFKAYENIFSRLGLITRAVEADTGVMGGKFSHEFQVPCSVGESEIVYTEDGSYAAAIEKAVSQAISRTNSESSAATEKFATPGIVTIDQLAQQHATPAVDQVKTLVYIADSKPVLLLLRGDHELQEEKLVAAGGYAEVRPATPTEVLEALGAHPGSLGAVGVKFGKGEKVAAIYADDALEGQRGMTTGANEDGFHLRNVDLTRDIKVTRFTTLRRAKEGELSLEGKPLRVQRAIEVGHLFKLGIKYTEKLGAKFLDNNGKSQPLVMGCYGIGVTRSLQAIIEQSHDKDGIIWPASVSPFQAVIVLLDKSLDAEAVKLQEALDAVGIDSIIDDRDERPGVKFKDADLIGFTVRITVGEKSMKAGGFEVKRRAGGENKIVATDDAVTAVQELLAQP